MKLPIFTFAIITLCFFSCEKAFISSKSITPQSVFDEMWRHIDENYSYFELKSVDWDSIHTVYAPKIQDEMSDDALYGVCLEMVEELRDGHSSLFAAGKGVVSFDYRKGYPVFFDLELIKSEYLGNDFNEVGNFTYGMLEENIAYVHFKDFKKVSDFAEVMSFVEEKNADALVFDVRNNSGGSGQDAGDIISYFINAPQTIGFIVEKIGPGHNDFSEKLSIIAEPADIFFDKPVHFLMNRGSFSASTYLAAMVKELPQVKTIGQITGGGGAGKSSLYLPNTWVVTVSGNKFLDLSSMEIEEGISPEVEIINDSLDLVNLTDKMLEKAIEEF